MADGKSQAVLDVDRLLEAVGDDGYDLGADGYIVLTGEVGFFSTGAVNSRTHLGSVEPFQTTALCGTSVVDGSHGGAFLSRLRGESQDGRLCHRCVAALLIQEALDVPDRVLRVGESIHAEAGETIRIEFPEIRDGDPFVVAPEVSIRKVGALAAAADVEPVPFDEPEVVATRATSEQIDDLRRGIDVEFTPDALARLSDADRQAASVAAASIGVEGVGVGLVEAWEKLDAAYQANRIEVLGAVRLARASLRLAMLRERRLVEALEHYAEDRPVAFGRDDGGRRAREALAMYRRETGAPQDERL